MSGTARGWGDSAWLFFHVTFLQSFSSVSSLWNIVEKGEDLSYTQDICSRPLGQPEWLGGDLELSDQFSNNIII